MPGFGGGGGSTSPGPQRTVKLVQPLPVSAQVGAQIRAVPCVPAPACGERAVPRPHSGWHALPLQPRPEPPLAAGGSGAHGHWPQLSGEKADFSLHNVAPAPSAPVPGCIAWVRAPAPLKLGQTTIIILTGWVVETVNEIGHTTSLAEIRQQ